MTQHTHTEFVPGCFRCDLSRDEINFLNEDVSRDEKQDSLGNSKELPVSFIEQVVAKSCFDWVESPDQKLVPAETVYNMANFRLSNYTDYNIYLDCIGATAEVGSMSADGSIPAPVVAQVIDTLIKNYREV